MERREGKKKSLLKMCVGGGGGGGGDNDGSNLIFYSCFKTTVCRRRKIKLEMTNFKKKMAV